ncbi:MAG TPA: glycosyltransferase [Myxococcales bacterium]|nr:glycosyltransferase [Myxococcales bacterium]
MGADTEITVVIPTYNRRARLALVLDALSRQSIAPGRFEAVVVDDGSQDGTLAWLGQQSFPFAFRAVSQANAGPAAARNRGLREARGELLLFLDDDVVPGPALIEEHLRSHRQETGIAVIGPLLSLPRYRQPWVAWEQDKLEKQYAAMLRGDWKPSFRQFWTGNASVARGLVVEAGGFDTSLTRAEDIELAARLALRGLRFRFNPAASGVHHAERSLESWSRMHRSYGQVEVSIHGRLGHENALDTLADNWSHLHPATKSLVKACIGRPRLTAAAERTLTAGIRGAAAAGLERAARAGCSLLANVLYWSGAGQALGVEGVRALFSRPLRPGFGT